MAREGLTAVPSYVKSSKPSEHTYFIDCRGGRWERSEDAPSASQRLCSLCGCAWLRLIWMSRNTHTDKCGERHGVRSWQKHQHARPASKAMDYQCSKGAAGGDGRHLGSRRLRSRLPLVGTMLFV